MSRTRRLLPVAGIAAVLLLTGCASASTQVIATPSVGAGQTDGPIAGNGLWLLGGTAAADEIVDAVRAAGTVQYSGTFTELTAGAPEAEPMPGRVLTVEFEGGRAGSSAVVTAGDQRAQVAMVDGRTYTTGNDAYAAATGLADTARGWVCSIGTTAVRDEWAPLLEPGALIAALLGTGESVAVVPPADADTVVEVIIGSAEAPVGILTVARDGAPLPVAFTAGDTSGDGTFSFSAWGEPVDVAAPADPVVACEG
ncbi:hypothetical protein LQ757_04970 [Agromyces sp. SYSU K20354]|uniref:hypothetical protein n=1 Tax=Agromyces cavernae TaxID=2898659 RepID=UPI001E6326F4|nr:hypothetical protein [Agromyces cavernae]MCD2441624.1 hypothetical protein [Agromyces cavernae]